MNSGEGRGGSLEKRILVRLKHCETEEMQWTYQVNGQFPKYKAPKNAEAKVKTQIDPSLDPYAYKMQLPQHRYVLENVAALHKQ